MSSLQHVFKTQGHRAAAGAGCVLLMALAALAGSGGLGPVLIRSVLAHEPAAGGHDPHGPGGHGTTATNGHPPAAPPSRQLPAQAPGSVRVLGHVIPKPELTAEVTAPIWGRVQFTETPLSVGQQVKKGQPLLRLILELSADERYLMQARKVEIHAAAVQAQTHQEQTERELQRAVGLLKMKPTDVLRQQQVRTAERLFKDARDAKDLYERQEKAYDGVIVRRDPRITTVEAPITGVITEVHTAAGELNPTGEFRELCTIADTSKVWIEADLYEHDLALVLDGARATFRTSEGGAPRDLGAPVAISPFVDEQTRTVKAIYEVSNPDNQLPLGVTVYVAFEAAPPTGH